MQVQTAPNILTKINIKFTGLNIVRDRWEIVYNLSRTDLIGANTFASPQDKTIVVLADDLTEWFASWSGKDTLIEQSFAKVIERENLVVWDGTVIDDIENNPDAATPVEWSSLIGQLVAPPNQVIHEGYVYSVVQAHTAAAQWPPNIVPALFALIGPVDNGGGNELPAWQPWPGSGPTYGIGAQVSHNGLCWESANANNTWEPGAAGVGDDIWFQIECP